MVKSIRSLFKKKVVPKPMLALPAPIIVRAAVTTAGTGNAGPKQPVGMLRMEDVMAAAGEAARQEGITDDAEIRARKLMAREVLKNARRQALAEGQPVDFTVGTYSNTVTPG